MTGTFSNLRGKKYCGEENNLVECYYVANYTSKSKRTRASVYKTLCTQHMLAPNYSLEMNLSLQRAITPEKIDGSCSKLIR